MQINRIYRPPSSPKLRKWAKTVIMLAASCILAAYAITDFPFVDFTKYQEEDEYSNILLDFYQRSEWHSLNRAALDEPLVITVDNCQRDDIGKLLFLLADIEPACVALDIVFHEISENKDSLLSAGLKRISDKLLWPYVNESIPSNDFYRSSAMSFSTPVDPSLSTNSSFSTVRFITEYDTPGLPEPISITAAKRAGVNRSEKKNKNPLPISFAVGDPEVYNALEILENPSTLKDFKDKIVFIGTMAGVDDCHPTSVDSNMPGVIIHALGCATILYEDYPKRLPCALEWCIAFLFAAAVTLLSERYGQMAYFNLLCRIIPAIFLFVLIISGYYIYKNQNILIDLQPTLYWTAAAMLVYDVWGGIHSFFHNIAIKIQKLKNE